MVELSVSADNSSVPDWVFDFPEVANRRIGGSVRWASDDFFAPKEALIAESVPVFTAGVFGASGQVYDGWETRRKRVMPDCLGQQLSNSGKGSSARSRCERDDVFDEVVIRLGVAGIIHGAIIDTSWFKGNFPVYACLEGAFISDEVTLDTNSSCPFDACEWFVLSDQVALKGDHRNVVSVKLIDRAVTHVRLRIFPDGGVARLRIYAQPVLASELINLPLVNVAGLDCGAMITGCSNRFYSSPFNVLYPGLARSMGCAVFVVNEDEEHRVK